MLLLNLFARSANYWHIYRSPPMLTLTIIFSSFLGLSPTVEKPLPVGASRFTMAYPDTIKVFTYKPANYSNGPMLVVFHGAGRNAEEYRNHAIYMAEKFKAIVVAPKFDANRFSGDRYQRGGLLVNGKPQAPSRWTYSIVRKLVNTVRIREGRADMPCYLIGHSAGGQFLGRMAAFMPGDACRIVACNPGSCLFPTRDLPYGYGFANLPPHLSNDDALRRYLASPLTFYLGTDDTSVAKNFDTTSPAMLQGENRIERGRACFLMAQKLAAKNKWAFNWRKIEAKGVGHSAPGMFSAPEVEDALFGPALQDGSHTRAVLSRR